MAAIQVKNGFSFNIANVDLNGLYQGFAYVASSSAFYVSYGGGFADLFRGRGFTYDSSGEPSGGVVTSYQQMINGYVAVAVTKATISVASLAAVAHTASNADDIALLRKALSGSDSITGDFSADVIAGYGGNDILKGAGGNDRIDGGIGNDRVDGGGGRDILTGGAGRDNFVFTKVLDSTVYERDVIRDFKRGVDKIDLSRMDADQDGTPGNQTFKFIGSHAFSAHDGELRFASGNLYGDVNGDAIADFAIRVHGAHTLSARDFYL